MQIAPGIHIIEAPLGDRFVRTFALVGDQAVLLIDSGLDDTPANYILPYLQSIGVTPFQIGYVLISHADLDHSGGNASLKAAAPQARFLCHELDRRQIENVEALIAERYGEFAQPHGIDDSEESKAWTRSVTRHCPVDIGLRGGEQIRLGSDWVVEVLHTAGHSRGHLTVYDPASKTAIIADAALWNAVLTKAGRPAFPPTYRYLESYRASIQRLQSMEIDLLLTSHYPIYRGAQVAEYLAESRAYTDRVDETLRQLLQSATTALTLKEIIATLSPRLGTWPESARDYLSHPLSGHLEWMQSCGLVERGESQGRAVYRWKG
ncbi:MAG: MBL fold metallo-hydrolase [Caldilineaceae bacterium]